ncbi:MULTISPECIES: type VI secretion system Vgr family protein [unclassified Acinetobacter]|uniref:type VI secretion system Vgr family protein n=1 Tax=unclassified Acinetobacter TaxID=196816 RepID=UPI0015D4268C|nr:MULTISPECIES: type VI secretion system Vgr family protein [unclassified Acinetobacter]
MLNNIYSALEKLGISPQKRALHIQFSNSTLNQAVFLQRIDGEHALSTGLNVQLICLSTSAILELKQFIGTQVAIDQVTDAGQLFRITGIITEAFQGQSDGALTLYKLTLEDATALWHKRRNSRVFMNKSVKDVVEIIFKEWQKKSPLFAASLSLDLSGLKKEYDVRPFMMQSNETDYDFITRLLRSEGIHWLVDEAQSFVTSSATPIAAQKLRLIDDNSQYQALERRNIRFHRSSATEKNDSMTSFIGHRSLQPTSVHVQRWQADVLEQDEGGGAVQSKHLHSQNQDNASLSLEQAWHVSPAWMQDLNGEDAATASNSAQVERLNQNFSDYYAAQAKQFIAKSTVRDTQVGYWFKLDEHPEIDQHRGADQEFLILSKSFYNQNNLPKDLSDQVTQLIHQSQWQVKQSDADERQANTLALQRRNITTVPEFNPLTHRPVTHPQRAKVVGPAGEEIHVDEWGRIKVRFLFTRSDDHSHDGGAGANNNDTDSAWVDVVTPWAGEGYGARFLPRVGEIVVVDFFDGNIDRPFVVGRIHEAQRSPAKFDNKGQLPDTKKLAGIRSKEVAGEGFGQLRFDDTTGQISTQLQSSHGASQLNLGKLSHPKDKAESKDRGEGFELRTDQWGAVRAGQGLLLSTYQQIKASKDHLQLKMTQEQFLESLNQATALNKTAVELESTSLEILSKFQEFIEQLSTEDLEKANAFKSAVMVLASPKSIGINSEENIHTVAKGFMVHSAGESINISTQNSLIAQASKKISLFAAREDASLITGVGKILIKSISNALDIISRKDLTIKSTEGKVYITSPTEVVITGGSSQISIKDTGIYSKTSGINESKAGQHAFKSGESVDKSIIGNQLYDLKVKVFDEVKNIAVKNTKYLLTLSDGSELEGTTDDKGYTETALSSKQLKINSIEFIDDHN